MRGPNGEELPGAILFACTLNATRSPMAAAMMRHLFGRFTYVESAGVRAGELDPLAVAVMEETGLEIGKHRPRSFEDLEESTLDLIVTLSPEAHHKALSFTHTMAVEVEYWPTEDATAYEGTREQMLDHYRTVRDELMNKIMDRFAVERAGET